MIVRIFIPILLLFVSCETKKEEVHLPKTTMAVIIAEMELSQAIYKLKQANYQLDVISLIDDIYKRNKTTKEEFNRSMRFYSQSPKDIDEIYNEVIAILVRKQIEIRD